MKSRHKVLARRKSFVILQDIYGRVWLTRRKKKKRNNRRQRSQGCGSLVVHIPIIIMSKYIVKNFFQNMDKLSEELEVNHKKEGIGRIMSSLLRPLPEVLNAVCEKQRKDVEELYKQIGWIWEKKL